jgi:EpsI family protein
VRPLVRRVAFGAALVMLVAASAVGYRIRDRLGDETVDPAVVARLQSRLTGLPLQLPGDCVGERLTWSDDVIRASGADAYGAVRYEAPGGRSFDVYVGGALRNNDNFHSPNVCLPTANWEALVHEEAPFEAYSVDQEAPRMQRMLMQRGTQQMVVYFWFQAGDRLASDEWGVRGYRLLDILRGKPLQPTLIVVLYVPVVDGVEETDAAARRFLDAIGPYLRDVTIPGAPNA